MKTIGLKELIRSHRFGTLDETERVLPILKGKRVCWGDMEKPLNYEWVTLFAKIQKKLGVVAAPYLDSDVLCRSEFVWENDLEWWNSNDKITFFPSGGSPGVYMKYGSLLHDISIFVKEEKPDVRDVAEAIKSILSKEDERVREEYDSYYKVKIENLNKRKKFYLIYIGGIEFIYLEGRGLYRN